MEARRREDQKSLTAEGEVRVAGAPAPAALLELLNALLLLLEEEEEVPARAPALPAAPKAA